MGKLKKIKNKLHALVWLVLFYLFSVLMDLLSPIIQVVAGFCSVLGKGKIQQWGINCWEGMDNLRSAQFGGDPDESISSRLGKAKQAGSRLSFLTDRVDLVAFEIFKDENHSIKSIEKDEGLKQVTGR